MAEIRYNFSELVEALERGDDASASELLSEVLPRLQDYLCVVMNAKQQDASECIHQAFLNVFEQIRKGNIKNTKYIFNYLLKTSRNEYIRYLKRQHKFNYDNELSEMSDPEEQLSNLMDKERQRILEKCLSELQEKSREFIEYFIDKPDSTTEEAVKAFNLSSANVRTKKSRILSRLHHCYKRKSTQ
ncbi:MAG: sigma-70 family RNA polymerase sigma factor [Balneolaceae bacterium]